LRPTLSDLQGDYQALCQFWGDSPERRARYRTKLRALAIRRREQKAEREKVGLPALHKAYEAAAKHMLRLNRAITGLSDCTPGIAGALRIMRPHLTGNIAADAADLLDNPDAPITERMAWVG
jgi:hypothetical protein